MYLHEMTELRSTVAGFSGLASSLVCRGTTEISYKEVGLTQGTCFKQLILFKNLYLFNFH